MRDRPFCGPIRLLREAEAGPDALVRRAREVPASSYSAYYRRMLPRLLGALTFRCNNSAWRPVIDALELLADASGRPSNERFYRPEDRVPLDDVVAPSWRTTVVGEGGRMERVPYELCALRTLRQAIRRREVWVEGANRWGDPDHDLPADFEANRDVHYGAIRQPVDPDAFVAGLRARLTTALDGLEAALVGGRSGGVRITVRRGDPWLTVPALAALPEPPTLVALKGEVGSAGGRSSCWTCSRRPTGCAGSLTSSPPWRPGRSSSDPACAGGCCWCSTPWPPTPGSATSSTR